MKMLITGSNGFLGSHFVNSYKNRYRVTTLSRKNADILTDLSSDIPISSIETDIVIHAAGKAHLMPKNKEEEQEFFKVNFEGTKKLINSLKGVKSFIFISSVSVYGLDSGNLISENQPLNGVSAYAKSKILTEQLLIDWSKKNNVKLLILRLPLLAANKPPGNLGAMIDAMRKKRYLSINKGKAKRSVVLVEDIVNWLPNQLNHSGIYNLTDNDNPSFRELEYSISYQFNLRIPLSIPLVIAKILGYVGDFFKLNFINSNRVDKMTNNLTFSCLKAYNELGWRPRKVKDNFYID